ncbi:MAG: outer membrane beta-barrel protein [Alphaproteobacteria bacterium]|nr:outer membrane beta-barrel protein [Alphaproteobacteria bacterium]
MHRFLTAAAAAALATLALAPAASATPFDGKLTVNVGVANVAPDESAKISAIGGTVDISTKTVPATTIDYRFSEKFSAELLCCVTPHKVKAVGTSVGTVDLGKVTLFPPTVTLKYHFLRDAPVKPYVGAGVNVTAFFNEKLPAGPVRNIDYKTTVGPALQVGANIPLSERLVSIWT